VLEAIVDEVGAMMRRSRHLAGVARVCKISSRGSSIIGRSATALMRFSSVVS
jgi:hypothetical protein